MDFTQSNLTFAYLLIPAVFLWIVLHWRLTSRRHRQWLHVSSMVGGMMGLLAVGILNLESLETYTWTQRPLNSVELVAVISLWWGILSTVPMVLGKLPWPAYPIDWRWANLAVVAALLLLAWYSAVNFSIDIYSALIVVFGLLGILLQIGDMKSLLTTVLVGGAAAVVSFGIFAGLAATLSIASVYIVADLDILFPLQLIVLIGVASFSSWPATRWLLGQQKTFLPKRS